MPDTATIGHNAPPSESEARASALIEAANIWLRDVKQIDSDERAARCQDFIRQIDAAVKIIDAERKTVKQPHLDAAYAVDNEYNLMIKPLQTAKGLLAPLRDGWLREIRRRQDEERLRSAIAAEEARKKAAEAAAKPVASVADALAAQKARDEADIAAAEADLAQKAKPQLHGELSGRAASFRTTWRAEIADLPAAVAYYLKTAHGAVALSECIQKLADADAKKIKAEDMGISGVRGVSTEKGV